MTGKLGTEGCGKADNKHMKFIAQIKIKENKTHLDFGSSFNQARFSDFCKKNIDKFLEIIPREKISLSARGYFEGAICPAYAQHVGSDPHDGDQQELTRELFKQEFNGVVVTGLDGKPRMIAKSTTKLNREEFKTEFIQKIIDYFVEHGIPVPNADLYKKWRDEWSIDEPLLSFWEWLDKYKIKCDCGVEEVNYLLK